ncbi:hypothetical protein AYR59_04500 [Fructilactobacillus lindneri]|uniref:DUF2628 domain-containing protein n=1 Tax=Fructilactobacillus lindneri TaxID=53444 RepID=A0AB33BIJ3_9LACO|nr:hypothetical protein [Fructilactobacillus lindneri]ANZ59313.1 hypothetical protein AYR59_04500 [Fructilactobacillus lindneri]
MMINLTDPKTDQVKQTKVGFSWTTFFFGFWPALFRGDWMWFAIMLVLEIVIGVPTYGIGAGITGIVFSFIYNKLYINELLGKGWVAADEHTKKVLITKGFIGPKK